MPYNTVHTFNPIRAALYGWKPEDFKAWVTMKAIQFRSDSIHNEYQFSKRYGGISCSATMMDGVKGFRFKMIGYSHPEYWDSVRLWVTDELEDAIFADALKMAGFDRGMDYPDLLLNMFDGIAYGPNALKYDLLAVSFSFISKRTIWRPDKTKVFCTEAVYILLLIAFPDILCFGEPRGSFKTTLLADQLTPSMGDMIVRDYARRQTPARADN